MQAALSVYRLDFASELIFDGDAGTTEAGRPSRRTGFEIANYYKLSDWLTVDADLAFARAKFNDGDPAGIGSRIPGAVEGVASVAIAVDHLGPWFGALQYRYFGPRPLIEDNSHRSASTATVNARIGVGAHGLSRCSSRADGVARVGRRGVRGGQIIPINGAMFCAVRPQAVAAST